MSSKLSDTRLSAAVVFKPLHKCHTHGVFLQMYTDSQTSTSAYRNE